MKNRSNGDRKEVEKQPTPQKQSEHKTIQLIGEKEPRLVSELVADKEVFDDLLNKAIQPQLRK